jgi:nucleotide-binding universal stress UspA family protein
MALPRLSISIEHEYSPRQAAAVCAALEREAEEAGVRLLRIEVTTHGGPEREIILMGCADCGDAIADVVRTCECGRWRYGRDWQGGER